MNRMNAICSAVALILMSQATLAQALLERKIAFDLAPQPMGQALSALAEQSNLRLVFNTDDARGLVSGHLSGTFTPRAALQLLLAASSLRFEFIDDRTVEIRSTQGREDAPGTERDAELALERTSWKLGPNEGIRLAQSDSPSPATRGSAASRSPETEAGSGSDPGAKPTEQITITGSRLRWADGDSGAAAVTVFDRDRIEQLGVTNVADVLEYLPQQPFAANETTTFGGSRTVRLRGLGVGTTLVLINGRRTATSALSGGSSFDLNTIPLSAVSRIEVLSSSASAIYGADAVGGVINVILKDVVESPTLDLFYGEAAHGAEERRASIAIGTDMRRLRLSATLDAFTRNFLLGKHRERFSDQDFRRFGGTDSRSAFTNPGNVSSQTAANLPGLSSRTAAVPVGSTGIGLSPTDFLATAGQRNLDSLARYQSVLPEVDRLSAAAFGEFDLSPQAKLFAEILYAHGESTASASPAVASVQVGPGNPFNPFRVPVAVSYMFEELGPREIVTKTESLRSVAGVAGSSAGWEWEASAFHVEDEGSRWTDNDVDSARVAAAGAAATPSAALNVFADGSAGSRDLLSSLLRSPVVNQYRSRATQGAGFIRRNLLSLPAGDIAFVVGAETRKEEIHFESRPFLMLTADRKSTAAYAELRVPVIGKEMDVGLARSVVLTLAGRQDHYSDFGDSFNPQYGIEWAPFEALQFRASYGTSFRPPTLFELYSPVSGFPQIVTDPRRGNEATPITEFRGGNPGVSAEEASSVTIGLTAKPLHSDVLHIGLNYWRIDQEQRVLNLNPVLTLANESLLDGRVVRATQTPADLLAGRPGRLMSIDDTNINFGRLRTSGVDFNVSSQFELSIGRIQPAIDATWVEDFESVDVPSAPSVSRVGIANALGTIPKWRATTSVGWSAGGASLSIVGRYVSAYTDVNAANLRTGGRVRPPVIADLQGSYAFGADGGSGGWLSGVVLRAGVVNVLDKEPEYSAVGGTQGFDASLSDFRQRFGYVSLSKAF